jgi:RimJ/RimL family protein N-acetyltransferase
VETEGQQQHPITNIAGEKVALGPIHRGLLVPMHRWQNDFEVMRTFTGLRPTSSEAIEAWYGRVSTDERETHFAVYERTTLRLIGHADLHSIDRTHRTAVFGLLIGEKDCWGRGYGTETTQLVVDYGFTGLNLHSIRLSVYSHNTRAIRAYERAGFRVIGRWRESYRLGGRALDTVFMDCLATEFESPNLYRLLPDG